MSIYNAVVFCYTNVRIHGIFVLYICTKRAWSLGQWCPRLCNRSGDFSYLREMQRGSCHGF